MIVAHSLGGAPQFAVSELGRKKTLSALSTAGLSHRYLYDRDGYVPEASVARFFTELGQGLGVDKVGVLFYGHMSLLNYGAWGKYVLSAPTLGGAIRRARRTIVLHGNHDGVQLTLLGDICRFDYTFGLGRNEDYENVAYAAIAVLASLPRHYLGAEWRPSMIDLDMPAPPRAFLLEDTFRCPVRFERPNLGLYFPRCELTMRNPHATLRLLTLADVLREQASTPPESFAEQVRAVLLMQLEEYGASAERVSASLGLSVRSLQQRLQLEGTSFRDLYKQVILQRGKELLADTDLSVNEIAAALHYSSPNNFTRFFTGSVDISPSAFRLRHQNWIDRNSEDRKQSIDQPNR